MSAWLRRARQRIACFEAHCGGADLCSNDERSFVGRSLALISTLESIEHCLSFVAQCDTFDVSPSELIAATTGVTGAVDFTAARQSYFVASGDLRHLLRIIAQRQARVAA